MAFVRSSKFRHVFGTTAKKDLCYDNIKVAKSPHESNMCSVNNKFIAVVLESQGGGAFMVAPITVVGRFDINYPKVSGHKSPVLDISWNPFNDCEIASGSEDCTVKVWVIPEGGLKENISTPKYTLTGHQRKVLYVCWHPCASNVLLSASADHNIMLWNVSSGEDVQPFKTISVHPDMIHSVSWNYNGSFIATSCKDKKIRVIDVKSGEVMREGKGHDGTKPSKVVFCGQSNKIFSTGFSRMSERQYALWEPTDLVKPLTLQNLDSSSGVQFPFWDAGTGMVYLVGKGDTVIRYFEVTEKSPFVFFLTMYQLKGTQRGSCVIPKRELDYMKCEVMRFYRLGASILEPIAMTVPRKSEMFQDDIYPPCAAGTPALTADEWCGGEDKDPNMLEFTQNGLKETTIAPYKKLDFSASGKKATSPTPSGTPRTLEEYKIAYEKLLKENASLKAQLAKN